MLSYSLNPKNIKILKYISELTSKMASDLAPLPPDMLEAIHRYARISNIGSSTRIENAVLTNIEIDWMDISLSQDGKPTAFFAQKEFIKNKLSKEKERSIEEVAGLRNVLSIVYTQAKDLWPLSEVTLRGLHEELLQYHTPAHHYAGKYKVSPNSVVESMNGKIIREVLKTTDPGPITQAAMKDLVQWYNTTLPEEPWGIAVMCEFVFRFLAIHPFQDGNGRMGRALFLLGLLHGPDESLRRVLPYLALDRHIEKNKEEYYLVLRKCSGGHYQQNPRKYKIEYFLQFMLKMFETSLHQDIPFNVQKHQTFLELSDKSKSVLQCFKEQPEKRLAVKDIVSELNIPLRTSAHILAQLTRLGFLQRYGKGPATRYQLTF